jgi:hypothetical protein
MKIFNMELHRNHINKAFLRLIQVVVCLVLLNHIIYISQQTKWSPIDEYAHMDYIEKLSMGHWPKISDSLCPDILNDIESNPNRTVTGTKQTRNELGLAIYSYQAKHPPIYYTLLTLPNKCLKATGVSVFERVKWLRWISFSIYVFGLSLLFFFRSTKNTVASTIPYAYIWSIILFSLLIFPHERYGLGNNVMSPLMFHLSLLALIRYHKTNSYKTIYLAMMISTLSVCSALTNVLWLPFFLILCYAILWKKFSPNIILGSVITYVPALAILWVWHHNTTPDPVIGHYIENLLRTYIPASMVGYPDFLSIFWRDLFTLHIAGSTFCIGPVFLALFLFNLGFICFRFQWFRQNHPWFIWCMGMVIIFFGELYVLNKYIDSVTWVAFRHYLGFVGLLFSVANVGILYLLSPKINSKIMNTTV